MANILFLAPADLGEAVLASGALAHALGEDLRLVTIAASEEARPLFRGMSLPKVWAPNQDMLTFALAARLRLLHFDTVIDGRGGWAGRIVPAAKRVRLRRSAVLRHRVEDWTQAMGADRALAPKLWLDEAARTAAAALAPQAGPLLAIAPGGASAAKRWPAERFAAIARRLAGGPLADAAIVVLGAAERDRDIVAGIVRSLAADGVAATTIGPGFDLLAAAALMERATLTIGNDNALTHIAAAAGAPTLTLFGPTDERVRSPWGPRARTLRGRPYEAIMSAPASSGGGSLLDDISVDAVEAAALELLHAGGLR